MDLTFWGLFYRVSNTLFTYHVTRALFVYMRWGLRQIAFVQPLSLEFFRII